MDEKILVVEDESLIRELLSQLLKKENYQVDACANGKEALQKIKEGTNYACALTDIKMPEMDGIEFLKQSHKISPQIPIIVVTGVATVDTAVEALKRGAAALIEKPFQSMKVLETLREVLSLKTVADRLQTVLPNTRKRWSIECPGTAANCSSIIEILIQGMQQLEVLSPAKETPVRDALRHALENAVDHGNQKNPKKQIFVNAEANNQEIQIEIQDEGAGFYPLDYIEESNFNEEAWGKSKGLFKIFSIADKVSFNAKGNKIHLTFKKA